MALPDVHLSLPTWSASIKYYKQSGDQNTVTRTLSGVNYDGNKLWGSGSTPTGYNAEQIGNFISAYTSLSGGSLYSQELVGTFPIF